jgi:hypothetical protein
MKKKVRKFQEGGFSAAQEEWLGGADRTDPYILARMRSAVPDKPKADLKENLSGSEELRDETGMVSKIRRNTETGDLYSTENAPTPKAVAKSTVKPAAKPSAPTMPAEEKARMENLVKKQGLERVTPEEMLIGGGSLKVLRTAGKKLADKIAAGRTKTYSQAEFDAMTPKLSGPSASSKTPALPSPTPKLPYDKSGALARKRADRAETRDVEMKRGNAKNYGIDPDAPGSASALDSLRRNIGDGEFSMKKGGKVKANMSYKSGGSVRSSASKRADGCAIRGKTRA